MGELLLPVHPRSSLDRLQLRGERGEVEPLALRPLEHLAAPLRAAVEALLPVTDPADHYKGKTIRATGTVKEVDGCLIEIDKAEQIRVVEK